jgi:hypothetical protein
MLILQEALQVITSIEMAGLRESSHYDAGARALANTLVCDNTTPSNSALDCGITSDGAAEFGRTLSQQYTGSARSL